MGLGSSGPLGWTKTPKCEAAALPNMANAVSLCIEIVHKNLEFLKRNLKGAATLSEGKYFTDKLYLIGSG